MYERKYTHIMVYMCVCVMCMCACTCIYADIFVFKWVWTVTAFQLVCKKSRLVVLHIHVHCAFMTAYACMCIQFKSALETMETYEWYNLNRQFWKYKPGSPLRDDKKAWWKYAFNAVSEASH